MPLRVGMTANAALITAERENVLLVPNAAITADRENGRFYVNRLSGIDENGLQLFEQVEVTIGLRDDDNTNVVSGLSIGDQVLVGQLTTPTFEFGGGPFGGGGVGDAMITMRNITKSYEMGTQVVHALRGVDLEIGEGEFVAIMGPSGSGKSTLMNMIGCLDVPTGGSYLLDGIDVSEMSDNEQARIRNQRVGFVFQNFNLLPRTSALKQVALPLMYAGMNRRERNERAHEVLELVGLGDRTDHRPDELSGGQQQRVAIARALATRPSIILADEPTGALDTETGSEILDLFGELHRAGMTIIVITHDPEVAERAERLIMIRDGLIETEPATVAGETA